MVPSSDFLSCLRVGAVFQDCRFYVNEVLAHRVAWNCGRARLQRSARGRKWATKSCRCAVGGESQTATRPDAIVLVLLSPGNAETCVEVEPEVRRVLEAKGTTGVDRPVVPGTAPNDTASSAVWALWVVCGRFAVVVSPIPIRAPLPGIPLHFIQTHGIENRSKNAILTGMIKPKRWR